jgi:membrane protein implicated in regulation of membrane protease activity
MPEPTAIATLGFLLLARPMPRWLFIVPVASCLFAGAMLWALHASEAWLAPLAAAVSLACLWAAARRRRRARRRRPRDSQRDSRRDSQRDSTRDSQRGPRRDSQRDSVRDSQRDSRRDPGRNSKR